MTRVFVIRPFGIKPDSAGKLIDFNRVHDGLITPALGTFGIAGGTTGDIVEPGNIREDMFKLLVEADLVIADLTIHNANVFYELGIRHALRKKRSILIKGKPVADGPVFDLLTDRYLAYTVDKPEESVVELTEVIRQALASERDTDSPIFKMLPTLPEVEPAAVSQVIPNELIEEIDRARAAHSMGWLRLLAKEVEGLRFEWPALRMIGQAQWDLEDYDGALTTFVKVVEVYPNDVAANLALANIYERRYRKERAQGRNQPQLFAASDAAIARVLSLGQGVTAAQRAEALALKGRNKKTSWRLSFETVPDQAERRRIATSATLREAYEAYRDAYLTDLNHFWSGLAAFQLGQIALDLSKDAEEWEASFPSNGGASYYREKLRQSVDQLSALLPLVIDAALERLPEGHKDRVWAKMGPADLAFLVEPNASRVARLYRDSVSESHLFAWDAAKGQMKLFDSLGFRPNLADAVIAAVEAHLCRPAAKEDYEMVIFSGHLIDEPGRPEPRFPPDRIDKARQLIKDRLLSLQKEGRKLRVLASAAPGSDIICHEVCGEINVDSTLCLPMPRNVYASQVFTDGFDAWRTRYFNLLEKRPVLELSDRAGLPNWLSTKAGVDAWERGNEWVLRMALSSSAKKIMLLALWNQHEEPGRAGGTGHSVRIARGSGSVDVHIIDARELLAN